VAWEVVYRYHERNNGIPDSARGGSSNDGAHGLIICDLPEWVLGLTL